MSPFMIDAAYDAGLDRAADAIENLYINDLEPANYTSASSTNKLGTKATPTIAAAADGDTDGRKRAIAAITDGVVDSTGTASHFSGTDNSLTELTWAQVLAASQGVTSGNTFSLTETDLNFRDAT